MAEKSLVAVLKLDSKQFSSRLSDNEKEVLKFSAAVAAAGSAALVAAKFTADYQDTMIKAARAAGVGVEEFSKLSYAAEMSGVSTEQLVKSFNKLNNLTPQAAAKMEGFGIATKDAQGNIKDSEALLYDMADTMAGMKDPADRAALAVSVFGEEGAKMTSLLSGGADSLRDLTTEAEKFGIVVSETAAINAELFNDNISRVSKSLQGFRDAIGESVIAFVNQSGIMENVVSIVSDLTQWWKGLSDNTKTFIVTAGGAATVLATITSALIGIIAVAPTIIGALAAISVEMVIATAGIVLLIPLIVSAIQYWGQMESAISPLEDLIHNIFDPWVDLLKYVGQSFDLLTDQISSTEEEISILGTISKTVFAILTGMVYLIITPLEMVVQLLGGIIEGIGYLGLSIKETLSGNFEAGYQASKKAGDMFALATAGQADLVKKNWLSASSAFDNLTVKVNKNTHEIKNNATEIGTVAKETEKYTSVVPQLSQQIDKAAQAMDFYGRQATDTKGKVVDFYQVLATGAQVVQSVAGIIQQFANEMGKISESIAKRIQYAAAISIRNVEKQLMDLQESYDHATEMYKLSEEQKIKALEDSYDAQIAEIRRQEALKNSILTNAAQERLLILDAEYIAAKQKKEEDFQAYLEAETIRYEFDKAMILQRTVDKEQAQLVESTMDADFKLYVQSLQQNHDKEMSTFASVYTAKQKALNQDLTNTITANADLSNETVQSLEAQKAAAVEAEQKTMQDNLNKMFEDFNKSQEALQQKKLEIQYDADVAAWESTKNTKIAETIMSGIAAAAAAFGSMAALGPVGLAIGAGLAVMIGVATARYVADLRGSQKPVKPAGLLAEGGFIGGNTSHSQGGFNAEIESKEFVIDKFRTSKIYDAIDNNLMGNKGGDMVFNFWENSIVGANMDSEETANKMSNLLAILLRRQGVIA